MADAQVATCCHGNSKPGARHDERVDEPVTVEKVVELEVLLSVLELLDRRPGKRQADETKEKVGDGQSDKSSVH